MRFLALISLARDILSILATGAGVERLFNSTRDIYYYRRGRLNTDTIQDLIIYLYTSRFNFEEAEYIFLKEFFSRDKVETANEEQNNSLYIYKFDPISDNKEDRMIVEISNRREDEQPTLSTSNEDQVPEYNILLPIPKEGNTQVRRFVRSRKRIRQDNDEQEYYQLQIDNYIIYNLSIYRKYSIIVAVEEGFRHNL